MTLEEKKKELLSLLPKRTAIKPAVYDSVKAELNTLVYEYVDEVLSEAPAASTRSATGIYQIILPSDLPEYAKIPLDIHENGHVVFQHLKNCASKTEQVKRQLRSKWSAFKAKIENDADMNDSSMLDAFAAQISNVAMDLEINSKYFGGGNDWKVQYENISVGMAEATIDRAEEISDEQFESLKKSLSDTASLLESYRGMHPEDFKFPMGLNWFAYINLMLTKPNEFMDNLAKQLEQQEQMNELKEQLQQMMQQGQGSGDGQQKQGKSNGSGNGGKSDKNGNKKENKDSNGEDGEKSNKKGSGSGSGKVKASAIKNAAEKQVRISNEAKEIVKKENAAKAAAATKNGPQNGDDDNWQSVKTSVAEVGNGHSRSDEEATTTNYTLDRNVRSFIEKCCLGNASTYEKQDPLYNYNRGKCGHDGVMRMRTSVQQVYRPGNLIAVIDVSGSVDTELVKALLNELAKYRRNFGYRSRIIFWDTDLVDDIEFKNFDSKIRRGGGTEIASGIAYAKQYLKSDADKLFIISDFEDYLDRWVHEIETLRSDVFGICWGGADGKKMLQDACGKKKVAKVEKMKVLNVK